MNTLPTDFSRMQAQQSYTDLNQLNDIRKLGNDDQSAALRKIAEQFESMFMQMMLKSMRQANDVFAKDNPLNSFEVNFHKDMLDNQMSLTLSEGGNIGLADALYRQLKSNYLPEKADKAESDGMVGALNVPERTVSHDPYKKYPDFYQKRNEDTEALENIKTPEDFINAITPYAKDIAEKMGADYKAIVAQAALETGWGEHSLRDRYGNHSFNLFNIKADNRWSGHHVNVSTLEYKEGIAAKESANFRRYDSIAESFADYQAFLTQPRYQKALSVAGDGHAFINELQQAGYATDPDYASKVADIINQYF